MSAGRPAGGGEGERGWESGSSGGRAMAGTGSGCGGFSSCHGNTDLSSIDEVKVRADHQWRGEEETPNHQLIPVLTATDHPGGGKGGREEGREEGRGGGAWE